MVSLALNGNSQDHVVTGPIEPVRDALRPNRELAKLRNDLKKWEKSFADANDGRKASREDIKRHADIAAKYKTYQRLQSLPKKKTNTLEPDRSEISSKVRQINPGKRKAGDTSVDRTPSKLRKHNFATPQKQLKHTDVTQYPDSAKAMTPQGVTFVGPTPQKDGCVLGLFDLLPDEEENVVQNTLSKTTSSNPGERIALSGLSPNTQCTPRMNLLDKHLAITPSHKHSRSPPSPSKRNLLDTFLTPTRRNVTCTSPADRFIDADNYQNVGSTPAFLQRKSSDLTIHTIHTSPSVPSRFQRARSRPGSRKGVSRPLSALIADIRSAQDERMDEELEILREMENGKQSGPSAAKKRRSKEVLAEDSQIAHGLDDVSGDGGFLSEGEDSDEEKDTSQSLRRVWKKKGQRRQTRRVHMKPVLKQPTQPSAAESVTNTAGTKGDATSKAKGGATVRTAVRKVKATAHANFRKLKIRSKGTTGKGGGARFRRRRR